MSRLPSFAPRAFPLAFALAALAAPAAADDRDLLRNTQDDPYVFIIFDVSGSMNWRPAGDAWAPASADDPHAKFYQAKSGLYRVLRRADDINFGFATYNQDDAEVDWKNWLYRLGDGQSLDWQTNPLTELDWPRIDEPLTFGPVAGIDGGNNVLSSCAGGGPNLNQTGTARLEARGELDRFPKLSWPGSGATTTEWFRSGVGGTTYRFSVVFSRASGELGDDSIRVNVRVRRWGTDSTSCDSAGDVPAYDRTQELEFVRFYVADNNGLVFDGSTSFLMWERDGDVDSNGNPAGFFDQAGSVAATAFCNGWDPNTDSGTDFGDFQNLRQPTYAGTLVGRPTCSGCLDRGDVVPLEWEEDAWQSLLAGPPFTYSNRDLILTRLAPNLIDDGLGAKPDFRQAVYFGNTLINGELTVRPSALYPGVKLQPLLAVGSTPIGASMSNFRSWFNNWRPVAAANDPRFGCKKVTLLILTDGDETCGGDPATQAGVLLNADVETYIIGFGLPSGGGNTLIATTCAGGGQAPDPDGPGPLPPPPCDTSPANDHLFMPNNEDELVAALEAVFSAVRETASAFASAAAPTLQANVEDKVIISSFIPLDGESTWSGRLDAFLKPVPVTGDGKPDRDRVCNPGETSECLLWDAGDSQPDVPGGSDYDPRGLLLQAPLAVEIDLADATTLDLGLDADQRRLFYSQYESGHPGGTIWISPAAPGNRRLLTFPTTDADKRDLFEGMGISFIAGDTTSESNAYDEAIQVIAETVAEKETQVTDPLTGVTTSITYLLGDIFHSNPVVRDQPDSFAYYTNDPYVAANLCGAAPSPSRQPPVSYRWFADRHLCRRKMLVVGSNDSQLHVFDAGIFRGSDCKLPTVDDRDGDGMPDGDGDPLVGAFDNGTGREVFSFVPRAMLPHLRELAQNDEQEWGVDGSVRIDDVFIDPNASTAGTVTCLEREWRTVLIGGYREGGPGYYALDITQPDAINAATNIPEPINGYVPSCSDGPASCDNRPFPFALWEFYDSVPGNVAAQMDEDLNGVPDLGNSWSVPATARIRVCDDSCDASSVEDRFVAVFGGGMGDNPVDPTGNFVYMVDIETGQVLWKEQVTGSIPADVATVLGGDGYLKTLYFGTTAGLVYKAAFESGPMRLIDVNVVTRVSGSDVTVTTKRLVGPAGDTDRYDPFVVFATNGSPIYQEIAVIYVQQRSSYALGFGTGNRWDLWDMDAIEGRYYVFLDTGFVDTDRDGTLDSPCGGCPTPLTESVYQALVPDLNPGDLTSHLTDPSDPTPGWFLRLAADERVITEGFALSGISIFTSFVPDEIENPDGTCSRTGESHIFIVGTVTGAGYWFPDPDNTSLRERYFTSAYFTSAPFVERGATGNLSPGGGGSNADRLTPSLETVKEELKRLFPPNCRFGNYTQNVKSLRQDTRIVFIAPVPICIEPTNFKEF